MNWVRASSGSGPVLGPCREDHFTGWGSFGGPDGDEGAGWPDLEVLEAQTRDFAIPEPGPVQREDRSVAHVDGTSRVTIEKLAHGADFGDLQRGDRRRSKPVSPASAQPSHQQGDSRIQAGGRCAGLDVHPVDGCHPAADRWQ